MNKYFDPPDDAETFDDKERICLRKHGPNWHMLDNGEREPETDPEKLFSPSASITDSNDPDLKLWNKYKDWRNTPRGFIEEYHREWEGLSPRQSELIDSAAEKLSTGLYAKKERFITELIQNADDTHYNPKVTPTFIIESHAKKIVIQYNEEGFTPKDVEAICTIGKSTKKDRKKNATGEKGIGFKAVFLVTKTPEIHSGNWHFRFDTSDVDKPHRGMITPEWVHPENDNNQAKTRIVLPLDNNFFLPDTFSDFLKPTILLFLRKLSRLEFHDFVHNKKHIYTRTKKSSNVISLKAERFNSLELEENSEVTVRDFFAHKQPVNTSDINEPIRAGQTQTDVTIVFELDGDNCVAKKIHEGELYAFLPVKSIPLPFICHGDFVLTTDRNEIKECDWNSAVRDGLSKCLENAVLSGLKSEPAATILRGLCDPTTIKDEFLSEIMDAAITSLKENECIPTSDGTLQKPKNVSIAPPEIVELFHQKELCLENDFAQIDEYELKSQLYLLGVKQFDLPKLMFTISSNTNWLSRQTPTWWARLYACIGKQEITNEHFRGIHRDIQLFPVAAGSIKPASDPPRKALSKDISKQYDFHPGRISLLDPDILTAADDLSDHEKEHFHKFLKEFGIQAATPCEVIEKHILKTHQTGKPENEDPQEMVSHLHYIRDHLDEYIKGKEDEENILADLGKNLLVKTTAEHGGKKFSKLTSLYLGKSYEDPHGLEDLFQSDIDNCRISPVYLQCPVDLDDSANKKRWADFFQTLGAIELPQPIEVDDDGSEDWPVEVKNCLEDVGSERQTNLLILLAKTWPPKQSSSKLVDQLSQVNVLCSENNEVVLSDCYIDSEENRTVFGEDVPFLQQSLNKPLRSSGINREFAQTIGVKIHPTMDNVLARLRLLSETKDPRPPVELYEQLIAGFAGHRTKISSEFLNHPLLLAHQTGKPVWATREEACWHVPARLRKHMKQAYLTCPKYDGISGFFTEKLRIKEKPDPNAYLDVLASFSKGATDDESQNICGAIYQAINDQIDLETFEKDHWVDRLRNENLFCSTTGEWFAPGDNIYVRDDETIASLFESNPNIHFLDIDKDRIKSLEKLFKVTDFKKLSTSFTVDSSNIGKEPNDDLISDVLSAQALRGLCRYFHHREEKQFKSFADSGKLQKLREIRGFNCAPLLLTVKLATETAEHCFPCRLFEHSGEFLFNESSEEIMKEIAREIIRYTGLPVEVLRNVTDILSSCDSRNEILEDLEIHDLPPESRRKYFGEESFSLEDDLTDEPTTTINPTEGGRSRASVSSISTAPIANPRSSSSPERAIANEQVERARGTEKKFPDDGLQQEFSAKTPSSNATKDRDGHEGEVVTSRPTDNEVVDETNTQAARGTSEPPLQYSPGSSGRRRRGGQQRRESHQRERMRSYVTPENSAIRNPVSNEDVTKEIEEHAVQSVMDYENKQGRYPVDANEEQPNNPGYDIASYTDAEHSNLQRYIEVKGTQGPWEKGGVAVTQPQHDWARTHKDEAWLYVVEYAGSSHAKLHCIHNYANRIWRYHLDGGWKNIDANNDRNQNQQIFPNPAEGMQVKLTGDDRIGIVCQIDSYGTIKRVTIDFENGDNKTVRWAQDTVTPMPIKE